MVFLYANLPLRNYSHTHSFYVALEMSNGY